ncbi:protein S100-A5 [Salmo trutta]|uniref:protein S100-A5 n=1 Tax=Salmo trutta TaxID=8032 RepID=UPI0011317589|nr:protein S100-A5-like [Salmo trutta]XP_029591699.1 protein S100-A5-like [Salmo trutta]
MAQPTPLEASLGALIMTFHKHAGSGDAKTLNKKKLTNLIKAELPNIARKGGPEVDDLMTMLDQDADGSVDFKDYITLIGSLAYAYNCDLFAAANDWNKLQQTLKLDSFISISSFKEGHSY